MARGNAEGAGTLADEICSPGTGLFTVPTNEIPRLTSWMPAAGIGALLARAEATVSTVLEALDACTDRGTVGPPLRLLAAELEQVARVCRPYAEAEADVTGELSGGGDPSPGGAVVPNWKEEAHDTFFHIRRARRSRYQWLEDRAWLFSTVSHQLTLGFFDRETALSVVRFIAAELRTARPAAGDASAAGKRSDSVPRHHGGFPEPAGVSHGPLDVWRRGHHFLATACVAARASLPEAVRAIADGDSDTARATLEDCVYSVQAITASYALAGEMSARTYNTVIRPVMCPPHTAVEMNGTLNLEYRSYSREWAKTSAYLVANRERFTDGRLDHRLIPAIETLFLSVLMESHIHVTAAWRLVRGSTALHQDSNSAENGVMVLLSHVAACFQEYQEFIGG